VIAESEVIVIDLDGTLCPVKAPGQRYEDLEPDLPIKAKLLEYKELGFYIIIYTARNMRTHQGNLGRINADTARVVFAWLDRHGIPYDEVHFGKPWAGRKGFYVDDKCVRPSEFLSLSYDAIMDLLKREQDPARS